MKKITAILCSVIMSCAMFVSCGEEDSSSKAETSSAAVTSEAAADDTTDSKSDAADDTADSNSEAADDTTDSKSEASNGDSTYAAAYTEKLKDANFSMDLTTETPYTGAVNVKMAINGDNFRMYMDLGELGATDMYYLDGKMYTLDEASKSYFVNEMSADEAGVEDVADTSLGMEDNYEFVSSEETDDGMICETYSFVDDMMTVDSDTEVEPSTAKYYFDKSTGDIKKIEVTQMGMTQTVTINEIVIGDVEITLPDLSDWTEADMSSFLEGGELDFSDSDIDFSEAE